MYELYSKIGLCVSCTAFMGKLEGSRKYFIRMWWAKVKCGIEGFRKKKHLSGMWEIISEIICDLHVHYVNVEKYNMSK